MTRDAQQQVQAPTNPGDRRNTRGERGLLSCSSVIWYTKSVLMRGEIQTHEMTRNIGCNVRGEGTCLEALNKVEGCNGTEC